MPRAAQPKCKGGDWIGPADIPGSPDKQQGRFFRIIPHTKLPAACEVEFGINLEVLHESQLEAVSEHKTDLCAEIVGTVYEPPLRVRYVSRKIFSDFPKVRDVAFSAAARFLEPKLPLRSSPHGAARYCSQTYGIEV
jgi:hypothetical protein